MTSRRPGKPATSEDAAAGQAGGNGRETKHALAKGDTLWDLAKEVLWQGRLWKKISRGQRHAPARQLPIGKELNRSGQVSNRRRWHEQPVRAFAGPFLLCLYEHRSGHPWGDEPAV